MAKTETQVKLSGSNSPTFIIKVGEAYYVTQSVAKYDKAQATTPEQQQDVDAVIKLFDDTMKSGGGREAVQLPLQNNVMSFQHVQSE